MMHSLQHRMPAAVGESARPSAKAPADIGLESEADRAAQAVLSNASIGGLGKASPTADESLLAPARSISQGGVPLTAGQRAYFEPRFGRDFSDVRLHTSGEARQAARGIGARAYTHGRDIAFAKGEYSTGLLAHELTHVLQQRGGHETIQRQPDDQAEIEMPPQWVFASDPRRAGDAGYARSLGKADTRRLRKAGTLSAQDRAEVNAKFGFFTGSAFDAYVREVKPALVEVTQEEIDMGVEEKAAPATDPTATGLDSFRKFPTYIDNEIAKVEYFTAELAIIHYRDGTKLELNLAKPIFHIDYITPREKLHAFVGSKDEARFFSESDKIPPTATFEEIRTKYSTEVKYYVEKSTGRIIPSHINMLTAPVLCGVLLNSFKQYQENVAMGVEIGRGGTIAIGGYAGAGGLPKHLGVGLGKSPALLPPLSGTARRLAKEMNELLATGGSKTLSARGGEFIDVVVTRQGSTLLVTRWMSKLPQALRGKGTGMQIAREFEDAAVEVARVNGAKTVKVDVGTIINPGWQEVLKARGYVYLAKEGKWVKTINL